MLHCIMIGLRGNQTPVGRCNWILVDSWMASCPWSERWQCALHPQIRDWKTLAQLSSQLRRKQARATFCPSPPVWPRQLGSSAQFGAICLASGCLTFHVCPLDMCALTHTRILTQTCSLGHRPAHNTAHTAQGSPGSRGGDENWSALKLVSYPREQGEAATRNRPRGQARPRADKAALGTCHILHLARP